MNQIDVLDHGYVKFIEAWGTGRSGRIGISHDDGETPPIDSHIPTDFEVGIIEAARQSTQGGFRGWGMDAKLLKYLYDNKHATPFEFAGMVIEVQAPIFVFREWHRHRTQSYNEMSARYAPLPDLYYRPTAERVMASGSDHLTKNKQAQSMNGEVARAGAAYYFLQGLTKVYAQVEESYKHALADGIPKELARLVMPVGHYSRMRASANLRNWLAFMTLRCDPLAQWEIRQYANAVATLIAETFPRTHELWAELEKVSESTQP